MNLSQTPNGGWQFYQSQTGWHAPFPTGMTHNQQVTNIIKHRLANRAITAKHNLATDYDTVSRELVQFQVARGVMTDPFPKAKAPTAQPHLSGAVVDAVAAVKKIASGAALLFEWEESGLPPVSSQVSEERAKTCAICPRNDSGGFTKYFTEPIANNIKARLSRLHAMNLTTSVDDKLKICSACLCPLQLKCHVPGELVLKKLKPEQRAELNQDNPRCWILNLATS